MLDLQQLKNSRLIRHVNAERIIRRHRLGIYLEVLATLKMASKQTGISASTPAVANLPSVAFRNGVDSSGPSSIEESSFIMRSVVGDLSDEPLVNTHILLNKKLSTLDLLLKAIEVVGVPRKGASYIAIQRWIINNKENVVTSRLKANLKKTVIKALENGILKRATVTKNAIGLRGHFILNKDSLKKKTQIKTSTKKTVAKKENKDIVERESLSDTEVTRKPRKKNVGRLNKSATEDGGRKKVTKVNATVKVKAIPAPKVKNAPAPKVKNAPAPKVKDAPAPKVKDAPAPKVKNAPDPKVENAPAPKVKNAPAPKIENVPAPKARNAPVRKARTTVASTTSVPESQIASISEPSSKSKNIPKPKMAKAKTKGMVDEIVLEEPEMIDVKHVQEKSKKKVELKPTKKNIRSKKLYTDAPNMSRKDLSDTELTVKPINRKSLKSYSSDTEVDAVKKEKATKVKGSRIKVSNAKKFATEVNEAGPSTTSKTTRKQKAKNAA